MKAFNDFKDVYLSLSERMKGNLYHAWVKQNEFMNFVEWERRVLNGEITLLLVNKAI